MDNMMPGDNSAVEGPMCGTERACYQELQTIRERLLKCGQAYASELEEDEQSILQMADDSLTVLLNKLAEWTP